MSNGVTFTHVEPIEQQNITIIGSGPSLKGFDFKRLKRNNNFIITINDSGKRIDFADAWFTLDPWGLNKGQLPPLSHAKKLYAAVPDTFGRRDSGKPNFIVNMKHINYLHRIISHNLMDVCSDTSARFTLSEDNSCISTGNSAYGALNLAYHMQPKKILLLGVDASSGYFYGNGSPRSLSHLPKLFASSVKQLDDRGIQVVNGSEFSKVTCFERCNLNDAVKWIHDEL